MERMKYFLVFIWFFAFLNKSKAQDLLQLNDSLMFYYGKGEFKKAIEYGEQALSKAKTEFGEMNATYASILDNLAALYLKIGNYNKAEPLFEEALSIYKRVLGKDDPNYALSLNNLAQLYINKSNYGKAEPMIIEAIKVFKKALGEKDPNYAEGLNSLAFIYLKNGEFSKAEPLFVEALNIRRKVLGESNPDYATSLDNLGGLYYEMGEYSKAEPLYLKAKSIYKKVLGEVHPEYAQNLHNLGALYETMGNYSKAELLYMEAIKIRRNKFTESHPEYAQSLNSLALLYKKLGLFNKSEPLYLDALAIYRKVYGELSPVYANSLNNLASLYTSMQNFSKAEILYVKALSIRKKVLAETHPDYANSLNNLGLLYYYMGNYIKAEPLYIEALSIRKKVLGEAHPAYARTLNNLAVLYSKMGNYSKAESLDVEAMNIRKTVLGESHPDFAQSLNNLADLYSEMGQYNKAEPFRLMGASILLKHLLSNFNNLTENEKQIWLHANSPKNEMLLNFPYIHHTISDSALKLIFNQQLILKSVILADTKMLLQNIQNSKDSNIQNTYSRWLGIKKQLSRQYGLPISKRNTELNNWENQAENLEKELDHMSSDFRYQQKSLHITSIDVQNKLDTNEAAIEFVRFPLYNKKWTDSIMYGAYILLKRGSAPKFIPLFEEKQLLQILNRSGGNNKVMIDLLYQGIGKNNLSNSLGNELYRLIWQPMEPYLKGIKKIDYSPTGKLYEIAIQALPINSTTRLIDHYNLIQYTSIRQVVLEGGLNQKVMSISLFGNPKFTMDSSEIANSITIHKEEDLTAGIFYSHPRGSSKGSWPSLPTTDIEVKKIKYLFDQNKISTTLFTQMAASEENLKALSGHSPQVLHIATHGFFLSEPDKKINKNFANENAYTLADDPLLRSGLVLAGANYAWSGKTPVEGAEDGIVTAYEISQLDLSNTELVVLSACETALGDVKGTEGVFGLQRAFKMAGVKKLIVSLWQVPDKETAELMTAFYSYWMNGKTINDAFAQAQADMRKKYPPYYWAAFVLVE